MNTFRFDQSDRTYPKINVRALTCQFDQNAWNSVSVDGLLHDEDPNWEEKIINEQ